MYFFHQIRAGFSGGADISQNFRFVVWPNSEIAMFQAYAALVAGGPARSKALLPMVRGGYMTKTIQQKAAHSLTFLCTPHGERAKTAQDLNVNPRNARRWTNQFKANKFDMPNINKRCNIEGKERVGEYDKYFEGLQTVVSQHGFQRVKCVSGHVGSRMTPYMTQMDENNTKL